MKAGQRKTGAKRVWHLRLPALIVALVGVVGVLAFLYPTIADWFTQMRQSQVISTFTQNVQAGFEPTASEQLAQARRYNEALKTGAIVAAGERLPQAEGSSDSDLVYDDVLAGAGDGVMGRIMIPSINLDLPIFHGTDDETLLKGIGHLEGTSLPVGGEGTRAVLTGHRGLANAAMFTYLDRVQVGDVFSVNILGEVLSYRVVSTIVVQPDETEQILPEAGQDLMTLVTCTPLGINSHRILVTGERIWPTPVEAESAALAAPALPSFPWWTLAVVGAVVIAGLWVWRFGLEPVTDQQTV